MWVTFNLFSIFTEPETFIFHSNCFTRNSRPCMYATIPRPTSMHAYTGRHPSLRYSHGQKCPSAYLLTFTLTFPFSFSASLIWLRWKLDCKMFFFFLFLSRCRFIYLLFFSFSYPMVGVSNE